MTQPSKAIILCAGFGTRLQPLTHVTPKALLPLWNIPVLEHNLALLESWGVREILINAHHLPGQIVNFVRSRAGSARLQVSLEPDILGTGGALVKASWFLDSQPIWLLNGDVAADLSPLPLINTYQKLKPLSALWLVPERGPRTVEVSDGMVTTFSSRHPMKPGTCTLAGLHLLSPRILTFIPSPGFSSIIDAYRRAMQAGERIAGVCIPESFWADMGTHMDYLETHSRVLDAAKQRREGQRLMNRKTARVTGSSSCHAEDLPDADLPRVISLLGWTVAKTTATLLPPRGSSRTFVRLHSGRNRAILVRYSLEREENALFTQNARLLHDIGVPAPRVLIDLPNKHLTVIEDAGDQDLTALAKRASRTLRLKWYKKTLDAVATLHQNGHTHAQRKHMTLCPPFTAGLYRWERELFMTHFLSPRLPHETKRLKHIMTELEAVARKLGRQPRVLLHRDLQSSNILLHRGDPLLIDFQGMRMGPASYDIASLLCDPYVSLSTGEQLECLTHYCDRMGLDADRFINVFWAAAVERLIQALGAFGRLSALPETRRFQKHIPPALRMLERILLTIDGLPCLCDTIDRKELL